MAVQGTPLKRIQWRLKIVSVRVEMMQGPHSRPREAKWKSGGVGFNEARYASQGLHVLVQFLMQGKDAEGVLQNICGNNVAVPVGKVVYTQMLNDRGGIEADLTITRLSEREYMVVTSAICFARFRTSS